MNRFDLIDESALRAQLPKLLEAVRETGPCIVTVSPIDERTLDQNRRLQAMCGDIAKQIRLHDGKYFHVVDAPFGRVHSKDTWRWFFIGVLFGVEMMPTPDGDGFITPMRSSKGLSKRKFSEAIELISAFGAERKVVWSDPQTKAWIAEAEEYARRWSKAA